MAQNRCHALWHHNDLLDITPLLSFSQAETSQILGYATSTLSKRWKEVQRSLARKKYGSSTWPYRLLKNMDQLYVAIVSTLDPFDGVGNIPPDRVEQLQQLLQERQAIVPRTFIRRKQS